jgi:ubiquinone/menaquinone biosynthesis C-methylase UbiE
MPTKKNQPIAYRAADYDHFTDRFVAAYDQFLLDRILEEMANMTGASLLLDVGTGTARMLLKLAERPEMAGLHLVGLDFFSDVLDQARDNLLETGLQGRISLLRADAHALPLTPRSVDLVISRSTLHHWVRPDKALQEIYRVLGPGGTAIVHEVRRDPNPAALDAFNRERARAGLPPSHLQDKYTPDEVAGILAGCGLGEVGQVRVPRKGKAALGFEVRLHRPGDGE